MEGVKSRSDLVLPHSERKDYKSHNKNCKSLFSGRRVCEIFFRDLLFSNLCAEEVSCLWFPEINFLEFDVFEAPIVLVESVEENFKGKAWIDLANFWSTCRMLKKKFEKDQNNDMMQRFQQMSDLLHDYWD
jgi:hypothetical protein